MIISIDPSYNKKIGIAWFHKNKINYTSILEKNDFNIKTRNFLTIAKKVHDFIIELLPKNEHNTVVIEDQWLGRNADTYSKLLAVRYLITGMLYISRPEVDVIPVNPKTWQAKTLKLCKVKSEIIKIASIKYASKLTNSEPTEDEADAITILDYAINYIK